MPTNDFDEPYLKVNTVNNPDVTDVKQTMINDILARLNHKGFTATESNQDSNRTEYTYSITRKAPAPKPPEKKTTYEYQYVDQPEKTLDAENVPTPNKDALDLMLEAVLPNLSAPTPTPNRTKEPAAEIKYQKQKTIDLVIQFDNAPTPKDEYKLKMSARPTPSGTTYG